MKVTIYHNPRCSKSRQTLQLIQEQGIEPDIIKYLETPPSAEEIKTILTKLAI
ncbi:MAG: arsenate reductase (glutaredoxin), partial [Methylococcales bacterium]|nr:arsenate reductase (glutaredoxin) [Methylococcales bacterium]